ncbi:MAG: hypothetical protein KKB88_01195 [Nanoarchaeota archaeon]|nr:hypothetical protein [Nanoarchaeota archaeon]
MNKNAKVKLGIIIFLFLVGIFCAYFVLAGDEEILDPIWEGVGIETKIDIENRTISYKSNNMTVDFKERNDSIGEATLKSHKTYKEVLKITTGKNKTVIWYEFSDFKEIQKDAFQDVQFIDMREQIENKTYTEQFENIEEMNKSFVLIPNPNYLKPINKTYKLVYKNRDDWLDYNSKDIPKENIIIGVQTDLFWGEFLDVQLNILGNKLDRHALVLGTNSGFVTTAPTDDPAAFGETMDDTAKVTKAISPATAVKITEIGWWCDTATEESNFEVGLYAANGAVVPGEAGTLLYSDTTNAKGIDTGWKSVSVDWVISPNTVYWLGVQVDDTATITNTNFAVITSSIDGINAQTSLPNPFGGGSFTNNRMYGFYAVWEAAPPTDETPPTYSNNQTNNTIVGQSTLFSLLVNDETALHPNGAYIFSTNNTGIWINESAVLFSATPSWANVTKVLNSTSGLIIGYRWYLNDTVGNINNTEIFILTTTSADTCTCAGLNENWEIDLSDYCVITDNCDLGTGNITFINTGTITFNATITSCQIGDLPADQRGYLGNLALIKQGGSC